MSRGSNKKKQRENQIAELKIKKRNGLMRAIVAFVGLAVCIFIKLSLTNMGFEWANSNVANMIIFVLALVAAGIAGFGSRDWMRSKQKIAQIRAQMKR